MTNNIKALRLRAGLTQKELAENSGVAQNKISEYERADLTNITIGSLVRIAEAIGVTINDIVYPLPEIDRSELLPTIVMEQYAADKEAAERGDVDAVINSRFL